MRDSVKYRYDVMGNITEVFENGLSVAKYEYDALGRLKREDNKHFAKTTLFSYDDNGNILTKYEYAFTNVDTDELNTVEPTRTVLYGYDEDSDRLLTIDDSSKDTVDVFEYDEIGNPTTYRGKSATWSCGREMTSFDGNTFTYDARGRRISKNNITFTYDSNGKLIKQSNGLGFIYDHTGLLAVEFGGSRYFYRKNAQNDIIGLLDNEGNVVVKYMYDAWGNQKIVDCNGNEVIGTNHIGNLNPFRYRSYYYDIETNLYFLKTRYYDPEICRFTTIDDLKYLRPDTINGINLYAYCRNNPVKFIDSEGTDAILITAYCKKGLPIVGHTALAIQDDMGVWYLTEYTGNGKEDAAVTTYEISLKDNQSIYDYIDQRYRKYDDSELDEGAVLDKIKVTLSYYIHNSNPNKTVYLEGDYSESLNVAKSLNGSDLGGYFLIANNCGQYINRILRFSDNSNPLMDFYHKTSITVIPTLLHYKTQAANAISDFFENIYKKYFSWLG